MGRVLGVDLGTRRVGLALTDPGRAIASPLSTLPFHSEVKLAQLLVGLCRERDADLVVVGLPSGEGARERRTAERSRRLVELLHAAGLAAETWDESFSSREAEAALRETGWRRQRDPGRVDSVAAALVLRDWLASRYTGPDANA